MKAASPFTNKTALQKWAILFLLGSLLFLLAACRGNNEEPTSEAAPDSAAQSAAGSEFRLECNQSCAERAQCGQRADGSQVVLMNRSQPAVANQDMAIPVGTTVTIQESRAENVREISSGNQFVHTFLRVLLPDQAQEGWVPEWCLVR